MKIILSLVLLLLSSTQMNAQVTGQAIKFDYDNSGQRILRYLEPTAVLNKQGDTLTQNSTADTIKKVNGHLLKDDILIKAYPNPVTDELIVENLSWKQTNTACVKIFDITGKLILSQVINEARKQLPLTSFVPGPYQVNYYLDNRLLTSWRIIKH